MISIRHFLLGLAALLLAACATPSEPLLGVDATKDFALRSVDVDASGLVLGVEGRKNRISKGQVEQDLEKAFAFVSANRKTGARKIDMRVVVRRFYLSSRLDAAITPIPSQKIADIYILEARTGRPLVQPFTYSGASDYDMDLPVHVLSAFSKLSVSRDYLDTIQSYAEQVNEGMFGKAGARRFPEPAVAPRPEKD